MKGIFGFTIPGFFGILLVVGLVATIIIYLWLDKRKKQQNIQATRGMLLCEFCSPEGTYNVLCEVFKGQIKKIEDKSRATFTIDKFVKAPKKGDQSIDVYYVLQDHCFPCRWPEGKPTSQQVTVMKTHYLVNDPIPKITYQPSEWNSGRYERTTSALAKYAQDEKNMQVLVSEIAGVWKRIEDFVGYLTKIPTMFIINLALVLICLVSAFLAYKAMSNTGNIMTFLGIGG